MVCFRLPVSVSDFLRDNVPNVSRACRSLVSDFVERLPGIGLWKSLGLRLKLQG